MDPTLARLHQSLINALRRTRAENLHGPVTVAEIYQDLIPYRVARTELGFDMNADYEHTLLRLLSGEGDLARIEPPEVRQVLLAELAAANPDVAMYRNYAACDVWVNVGDGEFFADSDEDEPWREATTSPTPARGSSRDIQAALGMLHDALDAGVGDDEFDVEPDMRHPATLHPPFEIAQEGTGEEVTKPRRAKERPPARQLDPYACAFCGSELPIARLVNFCPFCGSDQAQQPCPSCGEMIEPLWRFCISCGHRARSFGDHIN